VVFDPLWVTALDREQPTKEQAKYSLVYDLVPATTAPYVVLATVRNKSVQKATDVT
jgi:hypothetical protein